MAINDEERAALQLLSEAAKAGELALIETTNKQGERVVAVTTMQIPKPGEYLAVPVAKLFTGSPYDELNPPDGAEMLRPQTTTRKDHQ